MLETADLLRGRIERLRPGDLLPSAVDFFEGMEDTLLCIDPLGIVVSFAAEKTPGIAVGRVPFHLHDAAILHGCNHTAVVRTIHCACRHDFIHGTFDEKLQITNQMI